MKQQEEIHSAPYQTKTEKMLNIRNVTKKYFGIVFPPFLTHVLIIMISGWLAVFVLDHGSFWKEWNHSYFWLVDIANRWDAGWYLDIAGNGYTIKSAAFFPLYPALIRLFSINDSQSTLAITGLVLSLIFFILALIVIYKCIEKTYSEQTARRTIWLVALFPASFFLTAIYPTSLYLLAIGLYFLGLKQMRLWMIIIGSVAAALSWNSGFILASSGFIWVLITYRKFKFRLSDIKFASAAIFAPLLGLAIYAIYLWATLGTPFAALISEGQQFQLSIGFPLYVQIQTIYQIVSQASARAALDANALWVYLFNDIAVIWAIIGFINLLRDKKTWIYIPFVGICLLLYTLVNHSTIVESTARLVMVLFPLWAAMVNRIKSKTQALVFYSLSAVLLVSGNLLFAGGYWMT